VKGPARGWSGTTCGTAPWYLRRWYGGQQLAPDGQKLAEPAATAGLSFSAVARPFAPRSRSRARRSIHRERLSHSFRLTFERAPPGKGAIATKNDRPSPLLPSSFSSFLPFLLSFFLSSFLFSRRWTVRFEIHRAHFRRCYRTRRVNIIIGHADAIPTRAYRVLRLI